MEKKIAIVIDTNWGVVEVFAFQNKRLAEQEACCRIQKTIEENWDLGDEYAAEDASIINDFISKENYQQAIDKFSSAQEESDPDIAIEVFECSISKTAEKPPIREKDFFPGLEASDIDNWQDEVASGITKLGFEEWKKKSKK